MRGNGAFALVADVNKHFPGANFENGSLDDATLFEIAKRLRLREQFLHFDHLITYVSYHGYRIVPSPGRLHMHPPVAGKGVERVAATPFLSSSASGWNLNGPASAFLRRIVFPSSGQKVFEARLLRLFLHEDEAQTALQKLSDAVFNSSR